MFLLDQTAETTAQAVKSDIAEVPMMSINDFINKLTSGAVDLAIHVAIAIVVFYLGRFIIRKLHSLVGNILTRRKIDPSLNTFVLSSIEIVLYFILIITVIGILGIETSSFLALFASAGVAIGMALSGTLQNFAGGVLILLLKPYKVGDFIEAQGFAGSVKEIQMFSTIITTGDNKTIIIPNGALSTGSINNYSRQSYRRVDWTIGISYGNSFETAQAAILEIMQNDPRIVFNKRSDDAIGADKDAYPDPVVFLSELASSSVNLTCRAWVRSSDYWDVFFELNQKFYNELPKKGLSFPFPHMDVHITQNAIKS